MRALVMPDYRADNPYQTLLSGALEQEGVSTNYAKGYRRVLPITRATIEASCDVLHLHWLTPYIRGRSRATKRIYGEKLLLDLVCVKRRGVKVIWTVHNILSHDAEYDRFECQLRERLATVVDRVIVHNEEARAHVMQKLGVAEHAVTIIPHGHYRGIYGEVVCRDLARRAIGLRQRGRVYLNLGMLRPYKGIEDLFRAWQVHRSSNPDDVLVVAGKVLDASYEKVLRDCAGDLPGIDLRVGFVEDSQIPLYFSAADVVVLPFRQILTSGSAILAMSYDRPIVAPRIGGIPELLSGADELLYDADEDGGLVRALQQSSEMDLQLISQRIRAACDVLDWHAIARQTSEVFHSA